MFCVECIRGPRAVICRGKLADRVVDGKTITPTKLERVAPTLSDNDLGWSGRIAFGLK